MKRISATIPSLAHKIGETSKASSKLVLKKKKKEEITKETEPMASKRKENAIELRQKLLTKPKVLQQKKNL